LSSPLLLIQEIDEIARKEIISLINKWKTSSYIELPSEWAEQNRYLPQGVSNYPGKINHSIAPHQIEIQDCFHPDSGIKSVTVMKSTQSLVTTTIENVIGWAIRNKLHNILYIISSKGMAKMRSSAAIDVLIDYSGLQDCMKPISTRMKRKTADNTFYKELNGGYRLMMTSYNSIADAKSFSWDFIIFDEIDEAPYELKGQGDPEKLFEVRGITSRHLKMAKIGTPTTTQGRVFKNFMDGDRRYFFCKCPLCGEFQILNTATEGRDYGLTFEVEKIDKIDQVISETVHYICEHCKDKIFEYQKQDMLAGGKWVPSHRPINPEYRSYQMSNLISPIMFYSWQRACTDWVETGYGQNITRLKAYIINIKGEPWESRSEKKSWESLKEKAENREKEFVPGGGPLLTGGADIQKNRIELQVIAWGPDMESWPIDYLYFYGETENKNAQVWKDFSMFVQSKKYDFKNIKIPITLTAVDTGYNPSKEKDGHGDNYGIKEHIVYEFVARNNTKMIACRGNDKLKDMIIKEERVRRQSPLKIRYDVAVNELKDETFIKLDYEIGSPGGIHFATWMSDEYYKGFVSEVYAEIAPGKWGWRTIFDRNEPLDTYILGRGAAERLNIPVWSNEAWQMYENKILGRI